MITYIMILKLLCMTTRNNTDRSGCFIRFYEPAFILHTAMQCHGICLSLLSNKVQYCRLIAGYFMDTGEHGNRSWGHWREGQWQTTWIILVDLVIIKCAPSCMILYHASFLCGASCVSVVLSTKLYSDPRRWLYDVSEAEPFISTFSLTSRTSLCLTITLLTVIAAAPGNIFLRLKVTDYSQILPQNKLPGFLECTCIRKLNQWFSAV